MQETIDCVFFGCWNDITYRSVSNHSKPPRDTVLEKVKHELGTGTDMLIVAGDNMYGIKQKQKQGGKAIKKSWFSKKALDALSREYWTTKSVFLFSLGNHNVEDKPIYNAIETRLRSFRPEDIHEDSRVGSKLKYPHFYSYVKVKGQTRAKFIVIDTNVFDDAYTRFDTNRQSESSRQEACLWMMQQIREATTNNMQVILIGHHPIIYMKDDEKVAEMGTAHADELLQCITSAGATRITYLCADRHNYQHAELTRNGCMITQIVSGTGGAKPDVLSQAMLDEFSTQPRSLRERNSRTVSCRGLGQKVTFIHLRNAFGFCKLSISMYGVYPVYIPVRLRHAPQIQLANSLVPHNGSEANDTKINKAFKFNLPSGDDLLHYYESSKEK